MSKLAVTITNGEPEVIAGSGAAANTPPAYVYSHSQNYLEYHLAQDLAPWSNVDDISFGVPVRSIAGPIIFDGTAVTIDAGHYAVVIDATAMGTLDSEFTGFNVEVSISANPPNDPSSASSSIYTAILLPRGNSTFTPKYIDGLNAVISTPILANCDPTVLQTVLDELDSLTGGITVLTAVGPHQSFIGGPFYVQFDTVGMKKLLRFNTTNGLSVVTARIVAGDGSTQEIQKIVLNRPITVVELDLISPILYDGSTYTWTLQVYLTNPRTTTTTVRRLAIHNLWLYRIGSKLYEISAGDGVINTAEVSITTSSTPLDTPGGFRTRVAQDATVNYDHEKDVYPVSQLAGSDAVNPVVPAAHLLTGSSIDRLESVIVKTDAQLPNPSGPPSLTANEVRVLVDNGGTFDPNNPPLTAIVTKT
jgi:hypothetical protein